MVRDNVSPKGNGMGYGNASNGALAEAGEHLCKLFLRDDDQVPGGLWSWKVYVDGNVQGRGPGSTRKDPLKWYATLAKGEHRVVVRESNHTKPDRAESNTLQFTVGSQPELIVEVAYRGGKIVLSLAA